MYISRQMLVAILILIFIAPQVYAQHVRIINVGAVPNGETSPPTVITSVLAPYTDDARNRGIEGTVTVEGLIDEDGPIKNTHVVRGLGFGLDEAALQSVREWTFSAATRNGAPVSTVAQLDIAFNLRDRNAVPIGAGITPPKVLSRVEAQYTHEAFRAKIRDVKVILQGVVKTDGSVDVVRVVQGFAFGMTDSVIGALKQWTFTPGRRDGQDVDVALTFEFTFQFN